MYNLNRILICLDLTEMDDQLIKVASSIANNLNGTNFYFIHVVESLELPEELREKYPGLVAPVDETVRKVVEAKLEKNFKNLSKYKSAIDIVEGNTTDVILRWSQIKEVDLIIMGRKVKEDGSGMLPEKIVKLCHCSFFLIPFNSYHGLKRIMVPVDFSDNSRMALEQAISISKISNASIICHHGYMVPSGYTATGKSYAEFAEIMRANAIKSFNNFLLEMGLNADKYPCIYTLIDGSNPAKIIHDTALSEKMDLIVMGSKGRTGLASILLGSTAMKTVKHDLEIELLVVKNKSENMGFLEALLNI